MDDVDVVADVFVSSKLAEECDRLRIPGDSHLGEGSYFCHGCFLSGCLGVPLTSSGSPSNLGDINEELLGLEDEFIVAADDGDPAAAPLFLDISKSRAPLELKTELRALAFFKHGKGGLISDWLFSFSS